MAEELPPVVFVLTGDIAEFDAAIDDAKAKMADLQGDMDAMQAESAETAAGLGVAGDEAAAGLAETEAAAGDTALALEGAQGAARDTGEALSDTADVAADTSGAMSDVGDVAGDLGLALGGTAESAEIAKDALHDTGEVSKDVAHDVEDSGGRIEGFFSHLGNLLGNVSPILGNTATEVGEKLEGVAREGSGAFASLAHAGKLAAIGVSAAFVGIAAESVHLAMDFQDSVHTMAAQADISVGAADRIGEAFLGTAGSTIYSADQIVQAYSGVGAQLATVQGHALDASEAMKVMEAAMNLSEATGGQLSATTANLATVMQAFHLSASQAGEASDVLYETSVRTGLGLQQVVTVMQRLHTQLGITTPPLGQLGGLMVDLAEHGETGRASVSAVTSAISTMMKATEAVTMAQQSANSILDQLAPNLQRIARAYQDGTISTQQFTDITNDLPTAQAQLIKNFVTASDSIDTAREKLQLMGIEVDNSKGQFVGMASVIDQLHEKIEGETEAQKLATIAEVFGTAAAQKMLPIIEAGGQAYDSAAAAATRHNAAQEAAAKVAQTLSHQLEEMKVVVEDLATRFGTLLIPVLEHLMHAVADVVTWLTRHKAVAEALGIVIGGVLVTAIGAWVASLFMAEGKLHSITTLVQNVGKGVKWMASQFSQSADETTEAVTQTATGVEASSESAGAAVSGLAADMDAAADSAVGAGETIEGAVSGVATTAETEAPVAGGAMDSLLGPLGLVMIGATLLLTHWKEVWAGIKDAARWAAEGLKIIWQGLKDAAEDVWHVIEEVIVRPVEEIWDFLVRIWHDVESVTRSVWDAIKDHLKLVVEVIVGLFLGPFGILVAYVALHWHKVEEITKKVWHDVVDFLRKIPGWILDIFKDAGQWLVNAGKEIVMGLVHGIEGAAHLAWDAIKDVGHGITHVFHDIMSIFSPSQVFASDGQMLMAGLEEGIRGAMPAVLDTIRELAARLLSPEVDNRALDPDGPPVGFVDMGRNMMLGLSEGVLYLLPAVVGRLRAVADVTLAVFAGARVMLRPAGEAMAEGFVAGIEAELSAVRQAGGQLTEGLAEGITSEASSVTSAITTLLQNAEEAVHAHLKIASPSQVYFDIGRAMVQGLTQGIEGEGPSALASVERLLRDLSGVSGHLTLPTASAASLGGLGPSQGGPTTITIQIAPTDVSLGSAQRLAQILWPEIRVDMLRTTGRQTWNISGGQAGKPVPT